MLAVHSVAIIVLDNTASQLNRGASDVCIVHSATIFTTFSTHGVQEQHIDYVTVRQPQVEYKSARLTLCGCSQQGRRRRRAHACGHDDAAMG